MTLPVLTLKRASRSDLSQLVSFNCAYKEYVLTSTDLDLDEEGTRISLTIVDTPGFGDQIDNDSRYAFRLM